jgi:4-hydroxy-tetrahydrodipicolinate synthase
MTDSFTRLGGSLTALATDTSVVLATDAALFAESNPIPVKAAPELLGLCSSAVRLPLTRATREGLIRALLPRISLAGQRSLSAREFALTD